MIGDPVGGGQPKAMKGSRNTRLMGKYGTHERPEPGPLDGTEPTAPYQRQFFEGGSEILVIFWLVMEKPPEGETF